jgi:DNA-binding MarR family transcriptional regulator
MTVTETASERGTGTREKVLDKLAETPGSTAAEIAEAAGLGRSTVNKALARLEGEGVARREPGGRDGKTKLSDRWHLTGGEDATEAEQD